MKRLAIVLPVLALLAVGGWFAAAGSGWFAGESGRWETVEEEPFVRRVPASGELRSANAAAVGCPPVPRKWNFTITQLAPEGSEVREGQPVLGFDAKELHERTQLVQTRLSTARSRLERTRIQEREQREQLIIERAEAVARRARIVQKLDVPEDLEARVELEKLRLDRELADEELRLIDLRLEASADNERALIRTAENRVAKLERELEEIAASIAAHTVTAPRSGFVVHEENWQGEKPKVGEQVFVGQPVMEIADLSRMQLVAEVAEQDARWVEAGQRVEVRLDAAPDRVFVGSIAELGRLFREKSAEVPKMIFEVTIRVDEPDPELMRPGMAASVEILAPTDESLIQIPESAVSLRDGVPVVTTETGTVPVALGARWEGRVVVLDGLSAGDRIAVVGESS